ncbi:MAG: glycosyltransferase [Lachnospiraceae bacterium]|nr:glycosyltransferase [Lachnospiraceae bacterium]
MGAIKKIARSIMIAPRKKEYESRLAYLSNSFDVYVQQQEKELEEKVLSEKELHLSSEICSLEKGIKKTDKDVIIFASENSVLSKTAEWEIIKAFEENPETLVIYADEDCVIAPSSEWESIKKQGVKVSKRSNIRFKPVYSPETLLSYFYPANMVAFRKNTFESYPADEGESIYDYMLRNLYHFSEDTVYHLPLILQHVHRLPEDEPIVFEEGNADKKRELLKNCGMDFSFEKSLFKPEYMSDEDLNREYPVLPVKEGTCLSVIIPSKDNPEVLFRCIESLKIKEQPFEVQIIVVDNGSSEENKKRIEEASVKEGFEYIYEKEEFNFSHMNNVGARRAKGNLILLLNDDMEMVTSDALVRMAGQLSAPGVGAVGAKLLYPNSSIIQHVGITNAVDGPVHKFIGKDDREKTDYLRNRFVHDCIGVTGACLMLKKEDYDLIGGLKEELRIAYNDVDLCFSLRDLKKRMVLRPDCVFYHHESLSRGADHLSEEKLERLAKERKMLYSLHPDIYNLDPYESAPVAGGSELGFDAENNFLRKKPKEECPRPTDFDYRKYPEGIIVHFDRLEKEEFARSCGEEFFVLQGYHVVPMIDNMRFRFSMVFEGKNGKYVMPMPEFLRTNLEGTYQGATNLQLSGFCNFVTTSELPPDTYEIGIYADDVLKKLYLYQRTGEKLVME